MSRGWWLIALCLGAIVIARLAMPVDADSCSHSCAVGLMDERGCCPAKPTAPKATLSRPRLEPVQPIRIPPIDPAGVQLSAIDRAIDPCDDLYEYACGNWIKNTTLPAGAAKLTRGFSSTYDAILAYQRTVLDQLRTRRGNNAVETQVASYYGSCMDEAAVDAAGLKPIQGALAKIRSITDLKSASAVILDLQRERSDFVIELSAQLDVRDSRRIILTVDRGKFGLPTRDAYLLEEPDFKAWRQRYKTYIAEVLAFAGTSDGAKHADAILALETTLAKGSLDDVARRNLSANNIVTKSAFVALTPHFDWTRLWSMIAPSDVEVVDASFLKTLDGALASLPIDQLRAYLVFQLVHGNTVLLPSKIDGARHLVIAGDAPQPARWKRCLEELGNTVPDLMVQMFARDRFGPQGQAVVKDMTLSLRAAMEDKLDAVDWMDGATRATARAKLKGLVFLAGHPDKWTTYPGTFTKDWGENALAARRWASDVALARIGKPRDGYSVWPDNVSVVNMYNYMSANTIVVPVGILQPPLFGPTASTAANFGSIGVFIGHELSHGFDDQGQQFDAVGNFVPWWSKDTTTKYDERRKCIVDQYSKYEGGKVDATKTLGENVADIGGLKIAWAAYRKMPAKKSVPVAGQSDDRQFFLGWAQAMCKKETPAAHDGTLKADPHAPNQWRVNGAVSGNPDFVRVFGCKPSAKLATAARCSVW